MLNNKKQNKKGKYDNNKSLGQKEIRKMQRHLQKGKVMKVVTVNVASNNKNAKKNKKDHILLVKVN